MKKTLLIFVCFLFMISVAKSQWTPSGEIEGGNIKSAAVSGSTAFVITDEGLFSSADQGKKWESVYVDEKILAEEYAQVTALGNNVFLGTKRGLYLSVDAGMTWQLFNNGMPRNSTVLCVNAIGSKILATTSESMYISENSAAKFEKRKGDPALNAELPNNIYIKDLIVKGNDIYIATFGRGIFKTPDMGNTWQEMNEGLTESKNKKIMSIVFSGSTLLAGTNRNGIWMSRNGGYSWQDASEGLPKNITVNKLLVVGGAIWAATTEGIYVSRSGGSSWSVSSNGFPDGVSAEVLATNGSLIYVGTEGAGVLNSTSGGSWSYVNSGLKLTTPIKCMAMDNTIFIAGTDGSGLFSSKDEGGNWYPMNIGLPPKLKVRDIHIKDSLIFIATDNYVYISSNSGKEWRASRVGFRDKSINDIESIGDKVFACTENGIYFSKDFGKKWESVSIGLLSQRAFCITTFVEKKDTLLFAGTAMGIFVSSNFGGKWKSANNSSMIGMEVYTLKRIGKALYGGTDKYGAIKSTNKGKKWVVVNDGLDYKAIPYQFIKSGKKTIVLATSRGVYVSSNKGGEWKQINMNLANTKVYALTINDVNIFCGNHMGNVYFYPVFKK
ncbi:MAG: hypothetical protein WCK02_05075 [Bacteroidota bacterium]